MNSNRNDIRRPQMNRTKTLAAITLALALTSSAAWSQDTPAKPADASKQSAHNAEGNTKPAQFRIQTFYLTNVSQQNEANEILTALRNLLSPNIKMFLVADQNAIVVEADPDQLETAKKLIADIDRPRKTYRLTYTITELDAGKRIGTEHYSMIVVTGQRATLKQGSKVPVLTGSYNAGVAKDPGIQTQYTYLDIGMNFAATLDEIEHGARLNSKVEQSSVADEKSGTVEQDPIVRQTVLESTSFLSLGKPLMLGSVDIPGTTRHMDIEVVMEQVQ
jgi:type II secretory pathway component GspD/PulD (secretin)